MWKWWLSVLQELHIVLLVSCCLGEARTMEHAAQFIHHSKLEKHNKIV
jgi:hypothetical protein